MDAAAREALGQLVGGADAELLGDAHRIRELLQDTCPQSRREVMVLVAATEEGLPLRLRRLTAGAMLPGELNRLAAELTRSRGLDPVAAGWAVGAWAWALGMGPIPSQEQTPPASPERTPAEGRADLRPPQRPPAPPPTPEITEDRARLRRRRPTVTFAAAAVVAVLLAGTAIVAAINMGGSDGGTDGHGPEPSSTFRGQVLFRDNFSSTAKEWPASSQAAGWTRYEEGAYRLHGTAPGQTLMGFPNTLTLTEADARLRIEVDGRRQSGDTLTGYGIFCRFTGDLGNPRTQRFYGLEVFDSGSIVIHKFWDGRYQRSLLTSSSRSNAVAIRAGQVNHLRADCTGGQHGHPVTLSMWVNGHRLAKVTDSNQSLPPAGRVGVLTAMYAHAPVDTVFDNFSVYVA